MSEFIQIHALTSYPPANLNRDDLGRPKTAVFGGAERLRISSQCLKRHWRMSDAFQATLNGGIGTRTKRIGDDLVKTLLTKDVKQEDAIAWVRTLLEPFGDLEIKKGGKKKTKKKSSKAEASEEGDEGEGSETKEGDTMTFPEVRLSQLVHFTPLEKQKLEEMIATLAEEGRAPTKKEAEELRGAGRAVDVGLFGRMLAASPKYNIDAAAQVAHAITIHRTAVEDDYFTAVDDLNTGEEDKGAGHVDDAQFGAGLFYLYICVNRDALIDNLEADEALADKALGALVEAVLTVAPSGKQNSFGSRAYASYALIERGPQQPRSLSVAFLKPVRGDDLLTEGIKRLEKERGRMEEVYGPCADATAVLNVPEGEGTKDALISFVQGGRS